MNGVNRMQNVLGLISDPQIKDVNYMQVLVAIKKLLKSKTMSKFQVGNHIDQLDTFQRVVTANTILFIN